LAKKKSTSTTRGKRSTPLRVWEPTLRIGYVIVVAVFVALIAGRVNRGRTVELGGTEPGVEPILLQPVKTVDLNMQSIRWAVESLNKASPVRVELDAESFAGEVDAVSDGPPPRPQRLKEQNLAEAVAAILARFDRPDRPLTYIVENGWVILGRRDRLAGREAKMVRAYEVGDVLDREKREWLQSPVGRNMGWIQALTDRDGPDIRLISLVHGLLETEQRWSAPSGDGSLLPGTSRARLPPLSAHVVANWLIINGTAREQRDVQRLLFILRNGEIVRGAASQPTTSATRSSAR